MKNNFTTAYPQTTCKDFDQWLQHIKRERQELSLKRYFSEFFKWSSMVDKMTNKPLAETGLQRGFDEFFFQYSKSLRDQSLSLIEQTLNDLTQTQTL